MERPARAERLGRAERGPQAAQWRRLWESSRPVPRVEPSSPWATAGEESQGITLLPESRARRAASIKGELYRFSISWKGNKLNIS